MQTVNLFVEFPPDDVPGDLVVWLGGGLHGVPGQVVECADVPQHANLVKMVHGFICLFSNRLHIRGIISQNRQDMIRTVL